MRCLSGLIITCLLLSAPARANDSLRFKLAKVEFREAGLADAVEYLRGRSKELDPGGTGANILIDPKVNQEIPVSLTLGEVSIGVALLCIVEQCDLDYRNGEHAFMLVPDGAGTLAKKGLQPGAAAPSPQADLARDLKFPQIEFADAPLRDILQFLTTKSHEGRSGGLNLVVNHRVDPNLPVSLNVRNVPASFVLSRVAAATGVEIRVEPWAILIEPPGTKFHREQRIKAALEAAAAKVSRKRGTLPTVTGSEVKDPRSPAHPDYIHSTHSDVSKRSNALNNVYTWKGGKWTFVRYGSADKEGGLDDGKAGSGLKTGTLQGAW